MRNMPIVSNSLGTDQEDLNLGTLRFVYQTTFPVSFALTAEITGKYLYIGGVFPTLAVIDVSDPQGPFLVSTASFSGGSPFSFSQQGNYLYGFQNGLLSVFNLQVIASPTVLYSPVAASNVGSGSFGDISGQFIYSVRSKTSAIFQAVDISEPSSPIRRGSASTSALPLVGGCLYDNGTVYIGTLTGIQAFDVRDVDNIILLSSIDLSILTENITVIGVIKQSGSFLYINCANAANDNFLVIINKNNPTSMSVASITTTGLGADGYDNSIVQQILVFFPFVAINLLSTTNQVIRFYDVRSSTAPVLKQSFDDQGFSFIFFITGNQILTVALSGVASYILFGSNVSNVEVGSFTAGTGNVIGEIRAGRGLISGQLAVRNDLSAEGRITSSMGVQAFDEVNAYKFRDLLRYFYLMGGN